MSVHFKSLNMNLNSASEKKYSMVQQKFLKLISLICFHGFLAAHSQRSFAKTRLATVRSGPRPEPFLETVKKTGPYGLVNWDRSPDRKIRSGLGKNDPVSSLKWRPIKRPDRTVRYSGTAVQSGLSIGRTELYSPV